MSDLLLSDTVTSPLLGDLVHVQSVCAIHDCTVSIMSLQLQSLGMNVVVRINSLLICRRRASH